MMLRKYVWHLFAPHIFLVEIVTQIIRKCEEYYGDPVDCGIYFGEGSALDKYSMINGVITRNMHEAFLWHPETYTYNLLPLINHYFSLYHT